MNRAELEKYITENYPAQRVLPWVRYPSYVVFQNKKKKGFAFILNVQKSKLGLEGEDEIDIVNFKCSPLMIGSLISEEGIFPGWHMNKEHWISVALDGSVDSQKIKILLDISYELNG